MKYLLISIFFFSTWAQAQFLRKGGHETGNGGGGTVCPHQQEMPVQLLDLWEGSAVRGLSVSRSKTLVNKQLDAALRHYENLNPTATHIRDFTLSLYRRVEIEKIGFLSPDVAIAPPLDALAQYLPKGCSIEGIALYHDSTDLLSLDPTLYNKLWATDRAALFFHEGIYKYLRDKFGVLDSVAARNITACVFAHSPCPELKPDFEVPTQGPLYRCSPSSPLLGEARASNETLLVFAAPGKNSAWRFQWEKVGSTPLPSRIYFDLPLKEIRELNLTPSGTLLVGSDQEMATQTSIRSSEDKKANELSPALRLLFERKALPEKPGRWSMLTLNGSTMKCQPAGNWLPKSPPIESASSFSSPLPQKDFLIRYFSLQGLDSANGSVVPALIGEKGQIVNPNNRGLSVEVLQGLRFHGGPARLEFMAPEQKQISVSLWIQTFSADNVAPRVFDFPLGALIAQADHWGFVAHWDVESGHWRSKPGTLKPRQWHHLVLTYDRSSPNQAPTLYVDGKRVELTGTFPRGLPRSNNLYLSRLGNISTGLRGLNGTLRDVAIWESILTPQDVQRLYQTK